MNQVFFLLSKRRILQHIGIASNEDDNTAVNISSLENEEHVIDGPMEVADYLYRCTSILCNSYVFFVTLIFSLSESTLTQSPSSMS